MTTSPKPSPISLDFRIDKSKENGPVPSESKFSSPIRQAPKEVEDSVDLTRRTAFASLETTTDFKASLEKIIIQTTSPTPITTETICLTFLRLVYYYFPSECNYNLQALPRSPEERRKVAVLLVSIWRECCNIQKEVLKKNKKKEEDFNLTPFDFKCDKIRETISLTVDNVSNWITSSGFLFSQFSFAPWLNSLFEFPCPNLPPETDRLAPFFYSSAKFPWLMQNVSQVFSTLVEWENKKNLIEGKAFTEYSSISEFTEWKKERINRPDWQGKNIDWEGSFADDVKETVQF